MCRIELFQRPLAPFPEYGPEMALPRISAWIVRLRPQSEHSLESTIFRR